MKDSYTREEVEEIIKKYESIIAEKDKEIERLKRELWIKDLEITYSGILSKEELERIKNLDPTQAIIELGKILKEKSIKEEKTKESVKKSAKQNSIKLPTDEYIDKLIKEVESTVEGAISGGGGVEASIGDSIINKKKEKKEKGIYKDPFHIKEG